MISEWVVEGGGGGEGREVGRFDQIIVPTYSDGAHSVDPDQTPQNAASDRRTRRLHCLSLLQQFHTLS